MATDVGGSAEVVGQAGILVKNNLVDAVGELLKNPDKRLQLGKEARQRAEKHFSIPSMITAYESLYRDLLS